MLDRGARKFNADERELMEDEMADKLRDLKDGEFLLESLERGKGHYRGKERKDKIEELKERIAEIRKRYPDIDRGMRKLSIRG